MSETLLYRRVYYEYVGVAYEKHINCSSDADPAPKFCLQKSALKNLQTKQKYWILISQNYETIKIDF